MRQPIARKCDSFTQDMWLYLSGELGDTEHAQWDAHLETCDKCQDTLQDATDTLARFDNAPAMAPSSAGVENVLAVASRSAGRRMGFRKALGPVLAVAAVIALFLGNAESPLFGRHVIESRSRELAVSHRLTALDAVFSVATAAIDPESVRKRAREVPDMFKPLSRLAQSYWVARFLRKPTTRTNH